MSAVAIALFPIPTRSRTGGIVLGRSSGRIIKCYAEAEFENLMICRTLPWTQRSED
jgi:hypothetical protein